MPDNHGSTEPSFHPRRVPGLRWLLGYRGLGPVTRRNFRYDLISEVFFAFAVGMVIPELTQLVLKRGFLAAAWMLAVVQAQHAIGNLAGAYLTQYLGRANRVRIVTWCRYVTAGFCGLLALLPLEPSWVWVYVALLSGPAVSNGIVLNVRNALRHANYPASGQGRIYSRLIVLHLVCIATGIQFYGWVLDHVWQGHRWLYLLAGVLSFASARAFRRIRVRRERAVRARLASSANPRRLGIASVSVLWTDRLYGRFMLFQFLSGATVLMVHPVMGEVLGDQRYFHLSYTFGSMVRVLVPLLVATLLTIPSGMLFDAIGVTRFRAGSAMLWVTSRVLFFFAVVHLHLPLLIAGFVMQGFGRATGGVAFNIGHTRFSHAGNSHLYMGAHLILQGVRGTILPFVGIVLFTSAAVGPWMLLLAAGIQFIGVVGFLTLPEPRVSQRDNPGGE